MSLPRRRAALSAALCGWLWVSDAHAQAAFRIDGGSDPAPRAESAHVPWKGEGFIGAFGGARWLPQDDFSAALQRNNGFRVLSRPLATATGGVPFGFVFDKEWAAIVDFAYAYDAFQGSTNGGPTRLVDVNTFSIGLVGQRLFDVGVPWVQPYASAGLGMWLSTFRGIDAQKPSESIEANASGGFVSVGARFALGGGVGLQAELRAAIAEPLVLGTGIAQVGGLTGGLGFYYAWRQ